MVCRNGKIVILHYEFGDDTTIRQGEYVEASEHWDNGKVSSGMTIKVFDKNKLNLEDFIETMSFIKEHYCAIKIKRDAINGGLQITGIKHKEYEKMVKLIRMVLLN